MKFSPLKVSYKLMGRIDGMGSLEDHKGFGALQPQFWGLEPPLRHRRSQEFVLGGPENRD